LTLIFNNGSWRMLFRHYAGYVSVGPNLLAWIASFAPVHWIPLLFAGLALLVAGGAMTAVACDRSGISAPSRLDRLIVAAMLIVLPLGKSYMFTNVTYSQWHMLFLLLLLLIQPLPRTRSGLIGWSVLIAIVSVSNPLSFLGLPLLLLKWRGIRTVMQRSAVVLCGVIMVSYPVWGVQHHQLPVITPASCLFAVRVFLSRVIVESIAGPRLITALEAHGWGGLTAAAGTVLLAIWLGFRWWFHGQQTGQSKKVDFTAGFQEVVGGGMYLWMAAFAIVFISVHLRYADLAAQAIRSIYLMEPNLQRYVYVPKLIVLYLVLSRGIPVFRGWLKRVSIPVKIVSGLVLIAYLVIINVHNAPLYRTDPVEGRRLKIFLEDAATNLRRRDGGGDYAPRMILERDGDWDIVLKFEPTP